eukprot:COSAG06_NODE_17691_length_926_cov_1.296252_2_plen_135_part_01
MLAAYHISTGIKVLCSGPSLALVLLLGNHCAPRWLVRINRAAADGSTLVLVRAPLVRAAVPLDQLSGAAHLAHLEYTQHHVERAAASQAKQAEEEQPRPSLLTLAGPDEPAHSVRHHEQPYRVSRCKCDSRRPVL